MTSHELLSLPPQPARLNGVYWRPNEAFILELAGYLRGKRVLEVFAGNGLLGAYLSRLGITITCTTVFHDMDAHGAGLYHPVISCEAGEAVCAYGSDHDVLLMCWPTVTPRALAAVRAWGDARPVVFIGEVTDYELGHLGGCATDQFFEMVDLVHTFESYQGNMYERAVVYRLKQSLEKSQVPHFMQDPEDYFAKTASADLSADLERFTGQLPKSGLVVDAGCGSGRDSKWLIERGYEVYSYDPFDPLATLAAEHLARSFPHLEIIVHRHAHDELSRHIGPGAAVGIFASASVIFLTNLELIQAFDEFAGALAKGGRLYASFKSGTGWKNGSRHLQLTDAAFINSLNPKLQMVDCWSSQDTLGRGIGWTVFVLARLE